MSSLGSSERGPDVGPDVGPAPDDRELRSARRSLALFALAVLAALTGATTIFVGARGDDGPPVVDRPEAGSDAGARHGAGDVGPADGTPLGPYVEERQAALTAVDGTFAAVVSLTGYSAVDTVEDLLAEVEVNGLLVALPGSGPRRAPDVETAVRELVADARMQIAEIETLLPTVDDPEFTDFYAEELERFRAIVAAADEDAVVFGAVVVGGAADLRAIQSRASVRLVDVAEGERLADGAEVRGLRPEEATTAGRPAFRP